MARAFAGVWATQVDRAAERREAWQAQRQNMATYLSTPEWRDKRDRAFRIWRALGWTSAGGLLVARMHFVASLHGNAQVLLAWPVQDLAAFGFGYALTLRVVAMSTHHRMRRVGHHIGYDHIDTKNEVYTERWYEIWPVTETVNRTESLLRWDKPGRGLVRICRKKPHIRRGKPGTGYLLRTLVAAAVLRFWWAGVAFGLAWWHWGLSSTLTWLGMVGHRI